MLSRVEITTQQGATLALPLQVVSEGFRVIDIDGLDPVKANIVSSSMAQVDGEQYQSSRRVSRNIILKLGLDSGFGSGTARQLRNRLYSFMMPKSLVRLRFYTEGEPTVDIQAIVESNECPLFVKEPEATISLICHKPDFYDPTPVILGGSSTSTMTESLINYNGSIETGIIFTLNVDRDMSAFTIFHRPADNSLRSMDFDTPLRAGDVLTISTISGSKGAVLMRDGTDESVLYGISPYANYINMFPGPNYLRVYAEGAPVPFTIEYTDKYGGL